MKRLVTLVLAAGFTVSSLVAVGQGASATPFSDVPANHWAYQAIQSLAADGLVEGYPDGRFKGDRPLTRYEMAMIVARVVTKLQANGANYASKADLDKLQKLIDALKDELDSLGVRVTNLEDALDALDKRTKFAQSISLHGALNHNATYRQRYINQRGIGGGGADPFVNAFASTPDSNSPLEQAGSGNNIRFDDRFTFAYQINENLTVSIPVHLVNFNYGGEFNASNESKFSIQPDIVVNIAKAGALTNAYARFGQLDNLKSSRVGLAYKAPDATTLGPPFEAPYQIYPKGYEFGGILSGLTEFQVSFSRLDQNLINTQTGVADNNWEIGQNSYLFLVTPRQQGYVQNGPPGSTGGALRNDTFNAGAGTLSSVYLGTKGIIGTVYISAFNGGTYNNAGVCTSGVCPGGAAAPSFVYVDQTNQVVFNRPLPAGSTVTITYVSQGLTNNQEWQRYQVNARINQKFKTLPGAELGLSYNRIFDFGDIIVDRGVCFGNALPVNGSCTANANGITPVSDTVLGLDAQLPIPMHITGDRTQYPVLYGEAAYSKYTPDFYNLSPVTDSAAVVGLRVRSYQATASLQYQVVGANFFSGAPFHYYGNPPQLFSFWKAGYFPGFFGFANNLGINQTFDAAVPGVNASKNQALTFIYPVFNPFTATGPSFYSGFAPNTQGFTFNLTTPFNIGDVTVNGRLLAQHLSELRANGFGPLVYSQAGLLSAAGNGTQPASTLRMTFDKLEGGAQFALPAFGQKLALNLTGSVEHLARKDNTAVAGYVPLNPTVQGPDPTAAAAFAAQLAGGNPGPLYYPNYVDMYHVTLAAGATLPVTKDVVFGAVYNTQAFHGSYGTTNTQNIAERKDVYTLTATYNIPKTTSSIGAAFRNQKYTDYVLPTFNFSQNREDVNFTVRF